MAKRIRPELLALLCDVKENPQDLTPWLVLTDWLEENGDDADHLRRSSSTQALKPLKKRFGKRLKLRW